jgi:hypothetical protein
MDPFARKMWRAGIAYGGMMLAMAAALTIVYLHNRPRCGDRIVSESTSPDKRWTATVLERRCGEDEPFLTQINLRDGSTELQRGYISRQANENNIFSIEQDAGGTGLHFDWSRPGELTVRCAHCDRKYLRQQDSRHGPLTIHYVLFL